jgi:GNAT superfamily N-acetyltransferase
MGLVFELDPPLSGELRTQVIALWTDVTNAGGAVGFVAPVTVDQVRATADQALDGVASGYDRMLVGLEEGRLVALLFITDNRFVLKSHWRLLKRVMVSPDCQGKGYGGALLQEAENVARKMGLAALQVTVRGGQDIEGFYARHQYRVVGRIPGALRVAPGDDRDELIMWLALDQPAQPS